MELDAQDATRLLPDVAALNLHAALGRVNAFLETQGRLQPSERDWVLYKYAADLASEQKRE